MKRTLYTCAIATLVLTCILWITQSIKIMSLIIHNGIQVSYFIRLSIYLLPSLIFIILPIAISFATVTELNKAYHDRELIALSSTGLNSIQLAKPFILASVTVSILAYFTSFYLLPESYREFKKLERFLRYGYATILLEDGVFFKKIDGLTLYATKYRAGNALSNIFVHDTRNPEKKITLTSRRGYIHYANDILQLIMEDGTHQEYNNRTHKITFMTFKQYIMNISIPNNTKRHTPQPLEQFIHQLFRHTTHSKEVAAVFSAHGHQRIIWPLYCISLTIAGIMMVLNKSYTRTTSWATELTPIFINVLTLAIGIILEKAAQTYNYAALLMYWNLITPICYHFVIKYCAIQK